MTGNSITYSILMFCQYANIFSYRAGDEKSALSKYFRSNKKLLNSVGISTLFIIVLIYVPGVHDYFGF